MVLGVIIWGCGWLLYANIRHHFYPLPYEIILRGEEHRPASNVEDVTLVVLSSDKDIVASLRPEIRDVLYGVDFGTTVGVVIESNISNRNNRDTAIMVRRVFDTDSDTIMIESFLHHTWTITDDDLAPINMYHYVVLTFPKRDWWKDEMEVLLYDDERLVVRQILKVR